MATAHSKKNEEDFTDVLEALSEWQSEARDLSARHSKQVMKKLAHAAESAGLPNKVVDAGQEQIELVMNAQSQALNQLRNGWQHQMEKPASHAAANGFGHAMPINADGVAAANLAQFWLQMATSWQRSWLNAMTAWARASATPRD